MRIVSNLIAALLLAVLPAMAQPQGLASESLWKWNWVGDAQISPDGTKVAYVRFHVDEQKDNYVSAIWVVDAERPEGSGRAMTSAAARNWAPRWSPDGRQLAFLSTRGGRPQVYVLPMDGGEARQVTRLKNGASNPAWSPDGKRLAFTSRVGPGGDEEKLPPGTERAKKEMVISRLYYRADGAGYFPEGFTHIFVTAADGSGEPKQVTAGDYNHGAPAWSPDGKWIAFSAVRKPDADYHLNDSEIYVVPSEGGEIRQLTDRRGPDDSPVWSPDGKRIAYTGFDEKFYSYTVTRLYVVGADGSGARELTAAWDRSVGDGVIGDFAAPYGGMGDDVAWSGDGRRIYFRSAYNGSANVYSVAADGGAVTPLTQGDHDLAGFSLAANGRAAAVISSPSEPFDVYAFPLADPKPRRLTNVTAGSLKGRAIAGAESFWYKSFDGRPIHAWVMKPPGFAEGRKHPMILYIHGGPHAMYGNTFFHEFQVLAARGYVVLFTNPRGSSGYGQEFGNVIQHKYPGDDYHDLMAGVDELLKRGYVDEKRMAVMGGSGGGVLTSWVIGHTSRFAAAVPQRGVYNWASFVGTSDLSYYFAKRWFRGFPWEDPEDYYRRSPVNYAANITTPTLIIHNEEDWRVPISQGEELYGRLKMLKREVQLVRFPEEPHGLSRMGRPSRRIARIHHIAAWVDKYLKTGAGN
jgi:dipeptidyl aminopeptidase/acylaminoacyl peptidase